MTETLAALLCAHILADFVFQTNWMVENKRHARGLFAHGATVLVLTCAAVGSLHPALIWLTALHMATDLAKTRIRPGLAAFLGDQGAHMLAIGALALWQPGLFDQGLWAMIPAMPQIMAVVAGFGLATRAGGFAIGMLMSPFAAALAPTATAEGLPGAGRLIGWLERGLIFALVLLGQPEGVGLLIAAKSILRFGAVKDDRALSEYVIIGTLASVGWALLAAYGTQSLLATLPPLGIRATTP